jgi:cob(I)alamin adenosyltransferase
MAATEAEVNQAHREKMARIKAAKDRLYASKTIENGLLIVHTGTGKGKSTAAWGLAMRCLGHGRKIGVVQFVKSDRFLDCYSPLSGHAVGRSR